ncbi:MAG: DUF4003 domain-containing protein [Ruminococcaceae bacterium]|nr:DUF4003 domain-containing protein [Oscillospiraceae bacterium]
MENRDIVKSAFFWENSLLYPIGAALFADARRRADADRLAECRDLLKEHTGVFSGFRSYIKLPMICTLALSGAPERKMQDTLAAYACLKEHFFSSDYLPLAAMTIASHTPATRFEAVAQRTRTLYKRMKEEHPFLTSSEDSAYAAMLALSEKTDDTLVSDMERAYVTLKEHFFSSNAVQSLSHVIALGEMDVALACCRVTALFDLLKERGNKYGTDHELATLGVLALLDAPVEQIAEDLIAVSDYLKTQKGYGIMGATRRQRLLHAGMLVVSDYLGGHDTMQSAAMSSTFALIIAQQSATCAAIAASVAASNAASN